MFLNIDEGTEDLWGSFLVVGHDFAADEVPKIDALSGSIFFINTEFCRLEFGVFVGKGYSILALGAGPSVNNPTSVGCVCPRPAVGGRAGFPIGNIEANKDAIFFVGAKECIIEVEEFRYAVT